MQQQPMLPDDSLAILILRTLKLSQEAVASIKGCHKSKVVEVDKWFKAITFEDAFNLCDEDAIKRIVNSVFPHFIELSRENLIKAVQIGRAAIFRRYREDHGRLKHGIESKSKAADKMLLEHWRRLGKLAEHLRECLSFQASVSEYIESRFGGIFVAQWLLHHGKLWFSAESDELWEYMLKHLDSEFTEPKFSMMLEKFKVKAKKQLKADSSYSNILKVKAGAEVKELQDKLWLVIERGYFEGTCEICKDV